MSSAARGDLGDADPGSRHSDSRLPLHLNPIRLVFSASPWRSAWYLIGYVVIAWVLFSAAFTATVTAAVLAITLAGIPLLVAAAGVLRGCANVERGRLRTMFAEPVRGRYREVSQPGLMAQVRTRWHDAATWRDVAYLIGLWVPLLALDVIVLVIWVVSLAEITVPIWYRFPWLSYHGVRYHGVQLCCYFPNGPYGHGAVGVFIGSLPVALAVAGVSLVAFLILNYVLVATARAHALVARALLRAPADPLAEAKDLLSRPGPLPSLTRDPADRPPGLTVPNGT